MIILDSTAKKFYVYLAGAKSANDATWVVAYADTDGTTFTEASNDGSTNGATKVLVVDAPAASHRRIIKSLSIYNNDTANITYFIAVYNGAAYQIVDSKTLIPGASALYGMDQTQVNVSQLANLNKNFIINGEGKVYQRNAAYTLVKDTYGIAVDRFYGMATGTAVSAGTLTQATAATPGRSGYAHQFSGVTLTGTGVIYFRYRMEAKDALNFKNQKASFSCQVYHDVGSNINYTVYVRKANSADVFSAVTAISDSGAQSIASGAAATLKYENISMGDCSNGIEIEIKIEPGAITTKNFYFTEVQFEIGVSATNFEYKDIAKETMDCQKYYIRFVAGGASLYAPFGLGVVWATSGSYIKLPTAVPMRVPPTSSAQLEYSAKNDFACYDGATAAQTSDIAFDQASNLMVSVAFTHAATLIVGRISVLSPNNKTTAWIAFNVEL